MVGVSKEVVSLIYYLLPGFLAAWIFYGLTAHPKKSPFERAVQALIFTTIIRGIVIAVRECLFYFNQRISIGEWSEDIALVWSLIVAVLFGHIIALVANTNWYHHLLHKLQITERTSHPSEWFSTFTRHKNYIVLHLSGKRRLYGWVFEWPDQPDAGHFVITEPEWILDDNTQVPVHLDKAILVPATDVEMVEIGVAAFPSCGTLRLRDYEPRLKAKKAPHGTCCYFSVARTNCASLTGLHA